VTDYLVRVVTRFGTVRALACVTTTLVQEVCRRHGTYPTPCVALGRALTGGALMGALLKTGQRVALKFEGNGPLRKVVVEADSNGTVRGYVAVPDVDLPPRQGKIDVAGALGRVGLLTVTKDLRLKEPYQGVVGLRSGEIAEDLAYYLAESEQVPSAVALGVYVEPEAGVAAAGGFLVQSLPPADGEMVEKIIRRIGDAPPVTEFLRSGKTPEGMLEFLFDGIPYETLEKRPLAFRCTCSRERVKRAIVALGREEVADLAAKQEKADVLCEFCRERYEFSRDDVERILSEMGEEKPRGDSSGRNSA